MAMDHYDFNQDAVSESDFEGLNEHDGTTARQKEHTLADDSESDFDGFNSDDVTGARQRYLDQRFSNSSDSDLSDLEVESDSEGEDDPDTLNLDSNSDTSPRVSDDDDEVDLCVPDLKQNPIKWTEHFQTFNVPHFTGQSGPTLPPNWNPKSTPRDYFQLFWTDDLLNNIVKYTNQYARLAIMKKHTHQPEFVDNEWSLNGCNNISYEELCAYLGTNIILSVNPYHQLKHVFLRSVYVKQWHKKCFYIEKVHKNQ